MAEKETKDTKTTDTKTTDGKDQAAGKENEQAEENVGEFGDQQTDERSAKRLPRKEFQVLDLGNEDNVSDWLVNMLSGRLWDFAINNLEWAGDVIDRAISNRIERSAEKRQMALKIKELKQKGQEAIRKSLVNEDGTLNAAAAKKRTYDDKGNLIMLDDYKIQKGDKIVDAEGKPIAGKTIEDIEKQVQESQKRMAEKQPKEQQKDGAENNGKGGNEKRRRKKTKRKDGKEDKSGKKEKGGKNTEKNKEQPKKKGKRTLQAAGKSTRETQTAKESKKQQVKQNKSRKKAVQQEKNNTKSSRNQILDLAHRNQRNNANSNTRNNTISRGRNNQGR